MKFSNRLNSGPCTDRSLLCPLPTPVSYFIYFRLPSLLMAEVLISRHTGLKRSWLLCISMWEKRQTWDPKMEKERFLLMNFDHCTRHCWRPRPCASSRPRSIGTIAYPKSCSSYHPFSLHLCYRAYLTEIKSDERGEVHWESVRGSGWSIASACYLYEYSRWSRGYEFMHFRSP